MISRLESGSRDPTREMVRRLAAGLELDWRHTDALHEAAGYLPPSLSLARGQTAPIYALARALAAAGPRAPALIAAVEALILVAREVATKEAP